jgi:hypothetical protein
MDYEIWVALSFSVTTRRVVIIFLATISPAEASEVTMDSVKWLAKQSHRLEVWSEPTVKTVTVFTIRMCSGLGKDALNGTHTLFDGIKRYFRHSFHSLPSAALP